MISRFETIWVRRGLEDCLEVEISIDNLPQKRMRWFDSVSEVTVPGTSMAEKIANGKRTLVIDRRSGSLLDTFVNHDEGSICPSFPKLIPSTNCPYRCRYCFLQGTYRACRPFICAYVVDIVELEHDVRRRFGNVNEITVISAGEMSDPLACDVLGYMPQIVEMFSRLQNVRLLLLTKSGVDEIQPLLNVDHNGHTIAAWSITCEDFVARHEPGNVSIADRLAAAKSAQDAGYEVRFRIDPFFLFDGWQEAYGRTIDTIYGKGIRPARLTLGSFRLLGNLRGIIKARFPKSDILDQPLVNEGGKRQRYPQNVREEFYRYAISRIREHDEHVPVALCKETPKIHRVFNGLVDATKCNCLP